MHDRTIYHGSDAWRRRQDLAAYREVDVDPVARLRWRLDQQELMRRRVRFALALACALFWSAVGYIAWVAL